MQPTSSNLETINYTFQKQCLSVLMEFGSSVAVLCDFPSQLHPPTPHFKIFGLDNFPQFIEVSNSSSVQQIVILSQQSYILKKILFASPTPLSKPFYFVTRVSSSFPMELKIIELISSLPEKSFSKIQNLKFLSSFTVQIKTFKKSFPKSFDICELQFVSSCTSPSLSIPFPPFDLYGILSSSDHDVICQISQELAQQSLSHTLHNILQAKFIEKTECITLHIPIADQSCFDQILTSLASIPSVDSFIFSSIFSAIYNYPEDAFINFFPLQKVDPSSIISLLTHCDIPYFLTYSSLIYKATPLSLEEALLQAIELDIVIPLFISGHLKKTLL